MPRSEDHERKIRDFAHTFDRGVNLLTSHFAAHSDYRQPADFSPQSDRALRDSLVERMDFHTLFGQGYLEHNHYLSQVGAREAAEERLALAEKSLVWALIYASAARKANRDPDGNVLSRRVEAKIRRARDRLLAFPDSGERLRELQRHIDVAESHGWKRSDGDTRPVMFIGATWCLDTANVIEIMGSFSLPMHMLIMDEENRDEDGFYRFSDHAWMLIRPDDDLERKRIPVVIFPNGDRLVEPKPWEFMIELVKHKIV